MKEKTSGNDIRVGLGFLILFVIVLFGIFRVVAVFTSARFGDDVIRVLAFERLLESRQEPHFSGRITGSHVLETEHGEIRLERFSRISVNFGRLTGINTVNFENGRASHDLVVHGIVMPQNVTIVFGHIGQQIETIFLNRQEIIVSGIPLEVSDFNINYPSGTADISMTVRSDPSYITLMDSTQIQIERSFLGGLYMYKDTGIWEMTRPRHGILVKPLNETEFIRYRSIRFGQDWGEFIGGVLWE